jgi:hypothetical protein
MRKMIAGLAAGVVLALGGVASADFDYPTDGGYVLNLNVNGNPFYGKWAMVDDRPFVGIEALSDALNLPRKHYYKSWHVAEEAEETGDPLVLMATAEELEVDAIRFGGVTMVDLYSVAAALGMPVHHNFRNKTIQLGSEYTGHEIPGAWYRYLSRNRGWRANDDFERIFPNGSREKMYRTFNRDRLWDDTAPRQHGL